MPRLRRLALAVVVGVLVTLPTAGSAFAGITYHRDRLSAPPSRRGRRQRPLHTLEASLGEKRHVEPFSD